MTVTGDNAKDWTRENASLEERLIIGLLYLCSAIVFIILQFSVIFIFFTYKDFCGHLCYRIMLFISIADLIQLVVHLYGGIICLLDNSLNIVLEKTAGGLANAISMASWPLCFVLALNRLLVFLPAKLDDRKEECLFNWLIAFSLLHGLPFFIIYLTPYSTIAFRYYTWDYVRLDYNSSITWTWVEAATGILPLPYIILTLAVYMAIFCVLILQRRKLTNTKTKNIVIPPTVSMHVNNQKLTSYKNKFEQNRVIPVEWGNKSIPTYNSPNPIQHLIQHERRLLLQAIVQFFVEFSLCSIWFFQMIGGSYVPDGVVFNAFINWYWIFYNGFRPLVYLAMNKTVRKRLLALWLNRPPVTLMDFGQLQRGVQPQGIRASPRLFSLNKPQQNSGRMS
ncbi:hypothetical protein Mgra_00003536 [Meloidogyne graminicola]|uniref:Uncharacterized protein n=1 Tax=Meloidogyne graminicola TaxID=189291 RepID=A0A8S9ZVH7_9BILA|nr:hypothetical protein Mgra_00003536 [Meloidogyne graminicola]